MNLAFEFNGIYFHSDLNSNKNYHKNKWFKSELKGIDLICIWEDDWRFKKDIVKSLINEKLEKNLKIDSNRCILKEITNEENMEFLKNNHIEGLISNNLILGLFHENELVSSISFKIKENIFELNRFCTKNGYHIIEGYKKLFEYFIKKYKFNKIIGISNLDFDNGRIFKELGFKFIEKIEPSFRLVKNIKKKEESKKEENNNGSFKIWGCGHLKFEYITNKVII